ncbi:EI24 domain-containing protein [Streptomyces pactum]|uniref:EI24 domain-containing protein n=1 Tax=Streptomyces pactum TaxID=68249 RepID=A0ABS0NHJ5_9ACTN|nr:EI24 domain-containing protein [Streptomyces pactum]MBH5334662.1 EI24 domain-containing protein [Streptomyces pactum]
MRDLAAGFGYLVKGQRWVARHGRWWGFGMLPALITLVGYAAALVALALWTDDLIAWATPFADDWSSPWVGLFRGGLAVLLVGTCLLLAVITFTAVTLLVGQPFYESLSEQVDRSVAGTAPESGLPLWKELLISARESLAVVLRVALWGVLVFALGFLPFVGQTVIPVLGFCISGFFLAEELTAVALARRGVPLKTRLRLLRGRRMLTLGFGVPLTLLFLIPFVAVVLMPGAVAGATLLVRDLTGEDDDPEDDDTAGAGSGGATGGPAAAPPGGSPPAPGTPDGNPSLGAAPHGPAFPPPAP